MSSLVPVNLSWSISLSKCIKVYLVDHNLCGRNFNWPFMARVMVAWNETTELVILCSFGINIVNKFSYVELTRKIFIARLLYALPIFPLGTIIYYSVIFVHKCCPLCIIYMWQFRKVIRGFYFLQRVIAPHHLTEFFLCVSTCSLKWLKETGAMFRLLSMSRCVTVLAMLYALIEISGNLTSMLWIFAAILDLYFIFWIPFQWNPLRYYLVLFPLWALRIDPALWCSFLL